MQFSFVIVIEPFWQMSCCVEYNSRKAQISQNTQHLKDKFKHITLELLIE